MNFKFHFVLATAVCLWISPPARAQTLYHLADLGDLPGGFDYSIASDINDSGQVVGTSAAVTGYRAFRWTNAGGMQDLGDLPGGDDSSRANGINNSGQVVGSSGALGGYDENAFLWTSGGGMLDLGDLPGGEGRRSEALDINDSGQVVGKSVIELPNGAFHAFLWTSAEGMRNLGFLPGADLNYSEATALMPAAKSPARAEP
jgi:probable HAF family extracellular repeat protein